MPILKKLKTMLDDAKVSYEIYTHPLAYTAQEIAEKQHVSGKELAKVVMLGFALTLSCDEAPRQRRTEYHIDAFEPDARRTAELCRSAISHAATDAREYGLPALAGYR